MLVLFRIAHAVTDRNLGPVRYIPLSLYKIYSEVLLGIEIPAKTDVGHRLRIYHGRGLVVNDSVSIGTDVSLRQNVTLGGSPKGVPVLRDGVDVGAAAIILGPVVVGEGCVIGAGAVVTRDVPAGCRVIGNPALCTGKHPGCASTGMSS
ncbi:serine acetyltransferase [Gordonia sp. AC31]|nr:serine acetyltransferase [Gordonia sp. AC31]